MTSLSSHLCAGFSVETVARNLAQIQRLRQSGSGTQINIAFLGSETFKQRLDAVAAVAATGMEPVPILSARRLQSTEALESFLTRANGIARIKGVFLVGGDPASPQGPFADSIALMNNPTVDRFLFQKVGIAGYPEGHPKIRDDVLWDCLQRKVAHLESKGIDVEITTQLTFDAKAVVAWVERVRQSGIQALIRVGVPGPATVIGLLTFASQCRVATSLGSLQKHGWQIPSMLGRVGPENFLLDLEKGLKRRRLGRIALHIFPLGDLPGAIEWFQTYCGVGAMKF